VRLGQRRTGAAGRWGRLGLVLVLICVPGSINLAITALPFLLGLGRLRPLQRPRARWADLRAQAR
jgi:hypothetical protein